MTFCQGGSEWKRKVDRDVTGRVQQRRDSDLTRFVTLAP